MDYDIYSYFLKKKQPRSWAGINFIWPPQCWLYLPLFLASPEELARVQGLEPRHPESESGVLPLDDTRPLIPWKPYL